MSAPELIEHVVQSKPLKFQEKVREILESKVIAALEQRKINISSSMTEESIHEDEDEDDNLNFDFDLDDEDLDDVEDFDLENETDDESN